MRIAYLDCFSGISGDMFVGALLDAGVPFELFEKTVAELNVGARLERSRVDRAGIAATKLDVIVDGEKDMPREEFWEKQLCTSGQSPVGNAPPAERRDQGPAANEGASVATAEHHHHPPARGLNEILKIIAAASISERAKQTASEIFVALGAAEAKVQYSVSKRTHEIGVRMALEARHPDVLRMVVGRALTLALIGLAIGVPAAVAMTRALSSVLFGRYFDGHSDFRGVRYPAGHGRHPCRIRSSAPGHAD